MSNIADAESGTGRTGQQLYDRARQLIPGGTQLLSKRPEMHLPGEWPAYYSRCQGVHVWDLDNRRYVDMGINAVGACALGYGDPDVDAAVRQTIARGSMCTLNAPEEVELAELLCQLHPWARMARFARCGGEAMALAVRIARASTGRDVVAFCGYHGWHDWYLSANLGGRDSLGQHLLPGLAPEGVPSGLGGTALPFRYNQIDELRALVDANPGRLAAIVMEPLRARPPEAGFLEAVRAIASEIGAVLVVNEITAGFRLNLGGAHLTLGLEPDMAVLAKALGNGYPMAAIIGREAVMQAAQSTFISSTYWTDRIGPSAAIACIRKHERCRVWEHLIGAGTAVQAGWQRAADAEGLPITVDGIPPLAHFGIRHESAPALHTLFTQLMLDRSYLAGASFYATFAHRDEHIADYLDAVAESFGVLAQAISRGDVLQRLRGPVAHGGFKRLA